MSYGTSGIKESMDALKRQNAQLQKENAELSDLVKGLEGNLKACEEDNAAKDAQLLAARVRVERLRQVLPDLGRGNITSTLELLRAVGQIKEFLSEPSDLKVLEEVVEAVENIKSFLIAYGYKASTGDALNQCDKALATLETLLPPS